MLCSLYSDVCSPYSIGSFADAEHMMWASVNSSWIDDGPVDV